MTEFHLLQFFQDLLKHIPPGSSQLLARALGVLIPRIRRLEQANADLERAKAEFEASDVKKKEVIDVLLTETSRLAKVNSESKEEIARLQTQLADRDRTILDQNRHISDLISKLPGTGAPLAEPTGPNGSVIPPT